MEIKMSKILYVVTGLSMGGAEHIVCNLADKAKSKGYDVKIAYLTGKVSISPINKEIEIIDLGMKNHAFFFKALLTLSRLIDNFQPDVVHSHMIHANLLARFTRLWIKIPKLVCTAHNTNEGGRLRMMAYRLTHFLCDVFTNVSEEAARKLESVGAAPKNTIVPVLNGIDVDYFNRFSKKDNDKFTLVAVGRLELQKDYPNLLSAIKLVKKKKKDFRILIVGDGSQRVVLQEMATSMGLSQYIEWLGIRYDIPVLLNSADCFVLSSEYEGFGLVVAEAMACELPVVATDCGGVKEVIGSEKWLVPPKNAQYLSEKIIEIMDMTNEERKLLGEENRRRIVNLYSLDVMFYNYEILYKKFS